MAGLWRGDDAPSVIHLQRLRGTECCAVRTLKFVRVAWRNQAVLECSVLASSSMM